MDDQIRHIDGSEFVSLITANQRRIFAYILTLVPSLNDADDIMQETSALMWERKNDFTPGSDFVAWGARIAYYKILDYRKKVNKSRRMMVLNEQFDQIEKKSLEQSRHIDHVINRLDECVKKLSKPDKQILNLRYSAMLSVKEISSRVNESVRTIYYKLSRIQGLLLRCIERNDA